MNAFTRVKSFVEDETGLTVVEYVVGAGLMLAVMTGVFSAFSDSLIAELNTLFGEQ